MTPKHLRCAIYTRKSTDEGLEQPFNTLHAQRRACEDYIRSQAGEGWMIMPTPYDDGGLSGGDLRRPALQRLLSDIEAARVDTLVVYKVDRLTRSLSDFAKLVDIFDRHGVSFVSVTQAFNTTTSMGRLTLNILLSFAQFEREITGERIRDKIAASKAQGIWMGGTVPLGDDAPREKRGGVLIINELEARTVRLIFHKFLELGNTHRLQVWLDEEGVRSKRRITKSGRLAGGYRFSRGALCYLLQNRTYLGDIVHRGTVHPGRHPPIVDRSTFEATQVALSELRDRRRNRITLARRTLLNGLVFDDEGAEMRPMFSRRSATGQRYSYYGSTPLPPGSFDPSDGRIRRVPTYALEELVRGWGARLIGETPEGLSNAKVRSIVARIEIHPSRVVIVIRDDGISRQRRHRDALGRVRTLLSPGDEACRDPTDQRRIRITLPIRLVVRGGRKWPVPQNEQVGPIFGRPDPKLVRDLRIGHEVLRSCNIELDGFDRALLRKTRAPSCGRNRRMMRLAFLAPDIQRVILAGAPVSYPVGPIPLSWVEQRQLFGLQQPEVPGASRTV